MPVTAVTTVTVLKRITLLHCFADVNEQPTAMCLVPDLAIEDCTVLGHLLIEDPDHPNLKCDDKTLNIEDVEDELSLYRCDIAEGEDVLSNEVNTDKFSVDKLTLKVKKTSLLTQEGQVYNITVNCRHDLHPAHLISTMFSVNVKGKRWTTGGCKGGRQAGRQAERKARRKACR